jgi:hypothetical protein
MGRNFQRIGPDAAVILDQTMGYLGATQALGVTLLPCRLDIFTGYWLSRLEPLHTALIDGKCSRPIYRGVMNMISRRTQPHPWTDAQPSMPVSIRSSALIAALSSATKGDR